MAVLSLKTELDVAELLLANGWLPEEINSILVFPLPNAIFGHLSAGNHQSMDSNVRKATVATPTTIFRARQLLESAGWLDGELNSLLKPYLYGNDAWAHQTIHPPDPRQNNIRLPKPLRWVDPARQTISLKHYRRTMAIKRIGSLTLVITLVAIAIALLA
ncbi:hypothetical protein [Leptothoe spongobia]|uniref:Uncharacterized protein n=1 Tax=Leptothoe spongobia TAU-MAC 1115 TaxID=1967444 RepID=A0A947GK17_9CYAN|nr:hypothetical protein [Leptothoe spongobia]MBT9316989.1 hypothetical protein [Leptothoe spongobia TAU-MAC 1115]